jgi:hypothetical protein
MHPVLEQPRRLALFLVIALQAGVLLAELLVRSAGMPRPAALLLAVPLLLLHGFSCLASWYLCRVLPIDGSRPLRALLVLGVASLLAALLLTGLAVPLAGAVSRALPGVEVASWLPRTRSLVFVYGLLLFNLAVVVHYLLLSGEARRRAERRAYDLRLLAREAELAALRAQVDPHFLFNSLNSISGLVLADPGRARTMCLRLAELLRSSLRLGGRRAIALSEELDLARRYLEVERFRFGERLGVDLDVAEECLGAAVPPMVLQPLVENAVRHGIAQRLEGGAVRIEGRLEGGMLRLEVANPVDAEGSSRAGEGIGQANVEQRLLAFFGDQVTFAVRRPSEGEELYRVVLRLPFRPISGEMATVESGGREES